MRFVRLCLLYAVALAAACLFAPAKAAPPPGTDWVMTFSDNFDAPALDPAIWSVSSSADGRRPNGDPAEVVVSDNALHLICRHHMHGKDEWTSAGLWTRDFRQAFGYFEARLRYAKATGLTNLFRLITDQPISSGGFEIAVDEGRYPRLVSIQLHRPGARGLYVYRAKAGTDLSNDYHLYGLSWLPNSRGTTTLTWYVDGTPIQSAACPDCTRPVRLWLGTRVITGSGPFAPPSSGVSMDVDYVRVYQVRTTAMHHQQ